MSAVLGPQSSALKRLVLVRHGETDGQSSIRYFGVTDVPLSELGKRQMACVRAALATDVFDAVYTSALRRTVAAARIVAPGIAPQPVPDFNEINFGHWEGLTRDEIAARDPELFQQWRRGVGAFTYPEGDAVPAFRARVEARFRDMLPTVPARVLIVGHKGVISSIVADLLGLSPAQRAAWPIDLASIHILAQRNGRWMAEVVNDVCHMDEE